MEAVLTAIVAIVLIAIGILAFYYFYGVSNTLISVIKTKLLVYSLQNLLAGISTKLEVPYLSCITTNIKVEVKKFSKPITTIYKIGNVIETAYWSQKTSSKCAPVNPWLKLGSNCIEINFINILKQEYEKCKESSKCVITFYVLVRQDKSCILSNYVKESTRDFIIKLSKDEELEIVGLSEQFELLGPKIILLRVIFLQPTGYSAAG